MFWVRQRTVLVNTEGALVAFNLFCLQSLVNELGQRSNALPRWILADTVLAEGETLPYPGSVGTPDSTVK